MLNLDVVADEPTVATMEMGRSGCTHYLVCILRLAEISLLEDRWQFAVVPDFSDLETVKQEIKMPLPPSDDFVAVTRYVSVSLAEIIAPMAETIQARTRDTRASQLELGKRLDDLNSCQYPRKGHALTLTNHI